MAQKIFQVETYLPDEGYIFIAGTFATRWEAEAYIEWLEQRDKNAELALEHIIFPRTLATLSEQKEADLSV